jgi:hypothetical protein
MVTGISKYGPAETKLEQPFPGTEQPNFDSAPVYKTYFEQPELYRRLHLQVLSLKRAEYNKDGFGTFADVPDAILTVSSKGGDTGSVDYFPIGTCAFPPVKGTEKGDTLFEWDWKRVMIYKANGTDSFEFFMIDEDKFSADGKRTEIGERSFLLLS